MEEEHQHLLQPLIPSTTTITIAATTDISSTSFGAIATSPLEQLNAKNIINTTKLHSSISGIISRLALIITIGLVSIWANHEASKGFSISIINESRITSPGKKFHLFYVSNDEASRLVLSTSKLVENFLYPDDSYPKKQVNQVILRLASRNLTSPVIVEPGKNHDQFVLHISPSVLEEIDFRHAMFEAVQQGMSRIWLWDGLGNIPSTLVNGIVEYISQLAASNGLSKFGSFDFESMEFDRHCWKSKNPTAVAQFLNYFELKKPGFIRRLTNQALKIEWHDQLVEDALGMSIQHLFTAHNSSSNHLPSI